MKNSQKGSATVVLLVIIVIVLLGIVGYLYLKPTESQVEEPISQTESNQQVLSDNTQTVPKISGTSQVNVTDTLSVNTTPELLTYSGKTDNGISFSIKYPSSWVYYKFSCNVGGIAFWPKNIAPDFSKGSACSMNSFLESAPIVIELESNKPKFTLKDSKYQAIYDQMKGSLSL